MLHICRMHGMDLCYPMLASMNSIHRGILQSVLRIHQILQAVPRIHQKPQGPAVALQNSVRYVNGMDSIPALQRRAADELCPLIKLHAINFLLPSSLLWRQGLGCCRRLGLLVVHFCGALKSSWIGNRCPSQIIMACTGMHCEEAAECSHV